MTDFVDLIEGAFCDTATKMEWPRLSEEGTLYWPSPERHKKATPVDLENARTQFKERSVDEWIELFDRAPHVMHAILGDIFRETRAEAEREAGNARIGRRPKAVDGTMDELWSMVTPRFSTEPFGVAVRELIAAAPSLRAFAMRAKMNHPTLLRLISGEMKLDKYRLEAIARAGKVSPAYFVEYREMVVIEAITTVMRNRPNVSIGAYQRLLKAKRA